MKKHEINQLIKEVINEVVYSEINTKKKDLAIMKGCIKEMKNASSAMKKIYRSLSTYGK